MKLSILSIALLCLTQFSFSQSNPDYEVGSDIDPTNPITRDTVWGEDRVRTANIFQQAFAFNSFPEQLLGEMRKRNGVFFIKDGQILLDEIKGSYYSNLNGSVFPNDGEPICAIKFNLAPFGNLIDRPLEPVIYQGKDLVVVGDREGFAEGDIGSRVISFNIREPLFLNFLDYDADYRTTSDGVDNRQAFYVTYKIDQIDSMTGESVFERYGLDNGLLGYREIRTPVIPTVMFNFRNGSIVKQIKCFKTFKTYNKYSPVVARTSNVDASIRVFASNHRISRVFDTSMNPNDTFNDFLRANNRLARNNDYGVAGSRVEKNGKRVYVGNSADYKVRNHKGELVTGITVGEVMDTLNNFVTFEPFKFDTYLQ